MRLALQQREQLGGKACPTPPAAPKPIATDERGDKKGQIYKPLRKEFRHDGFDLHQIAREADAAIYQQTWPGCSSTASYEVVRIRQREGLWIGRTFLEPAEVYPKSEAWGVDGWTVQDKEAAFHKLREVVASLQALVPTLEAEKPGYDL